MKSPKTNTPSVVDTAKVLDAAEKHAKTTRRDLASKHSMLERSQDRNLEAEAELARALEDHRQSVRKIK